MKCFRNLFFVLLYVNIALKALLPPPDSLEIRFHPYSWNRFPESSKCFANDTIPHETSPELFQWMGMNGYNNPWYFLCTSEFYSTDAWVWNSHVLTEQNPLQPFSLKSFKPFIRLKGIAGSRQWQDFNGIFSFPAMRNQIQNTVMLQRFGGLGFYQRQQTFFNRLMTSSAGEFTGFSYGFYVTHQKQKFQENGGLESDTLSDIEEEESKEFMPVNFSFANVRNSDWNVYFNIYKILQKKTDSLSGSGIFRLGMEARYFQKSFLYQHDNVWSDSDYSLFFLDTTKTRDSLTFRQVFAGPAVIWNRGKGFHRIYYHLSLGNAGPRPDSVFHAAQVGFQTRWVSKALAFSAYGNIYPYGYMQSAFFAGLSASQKHRFLDTTGEISAAYSIHRRWPDAMVFGFYGNHFQWSAMPEFIIRHTGIIQYQHSRLVAEVGFIYSSAEYVFGPDAYPIRLNVPVLKYHVNTKIPLRLSEFWVNEFSFRYQGTDYPAAFRFPLYLIGIKSYADLKLFKKNLWLQPGAECRYIPSFVPYAYMPNTQVFYLKELPAVREYYWISLFLSARIAPAQFYIKAENLMYLWEHKTMGWVYRYKQPGFWIHAGIMWDFRD